MNVHIQLGTALLWFSLLLVGCTHNPADLLTKEMRALGYTPHRPPGTDEGPGWIFRIAKASDGSNQQIRVCENLYPEDRSRNYPIALTQHAITKTFDAELDAALLGGLVKNLSDANANLKRTAIRKIMISWTDPFKKTLGDEDMIGADGVQVPLSDNCAGRLRTLKNQGKLDTVYLLYDAVGVGSAEITADVDLSTSAGAGVTLYKLLGIKGGLKVEEKGPSSIKITQPMYIGLRPPIQLTDFIPTDQLGAETATVSGKVLSDAEWVALVGR